MYQDDDIGYVIDDDYVDENVELSRDNSDFSNNDDDYEFENKKKKPNIIVIVLVIILIVLIFILLSRCSKDDPGMPSIRILEEQIKVKISNTVNIPIEKSNVVSDNINWQCINEQIATIDNNGNVYGVKLGKTNILATYVHTDYQNYSDECEVIVYQGDENTSLVDISLESQIRVKLGNQANINASFNPPNAYVYSIEYKSSNPEIASVNENGVIMANKVGKTSVSVIVNETVSKTIEVEVYDKEVNNNNNNDDKNNNPANTKPTSVKFNNDKINMMVNKTNKLLYTVLPKTAKDYKVTFKNSDNTVLRVDSDGTIKALSVGTSKITISVNDTLTDTITINVTPYVISVEQIVLKSSASVNLNIGGKSQIQYEIIPSNSSYKMVSYSSSNPSVATVDTNGLITAVGNGSCVITGKTVNDKTIKVTVNVN